MAILTTYPSATGFIVPPFELSLDRITEFSTKAVAAPLLSSHQKYDDFTYIQEHFRTRNWSLQVTNSDGDLIPSSVVVEALYKKPDFKALSYPVPARELYREVSARRNSLTVNFISHVIGKEIDLPNKDELLFKSMKKSEVMPVFLKSLQYFSAGDIENWSTLLSDDAFCTPNSHTLISGNAKIKEYFEQQKNIHHMLNNETNFFAYSKGSIAIHTTSTGIIEETGETFSYPSSTQLFFRKERDSVVIFGIVITIENEEAKARIKGFSKKNDKKASAALDSQVTSEDYFIPAKSQKLRKLTHALAAKRLSLTVVDSNLHVIPLEFQEAFLIEIKRNHVRSKYSPDLQPTYYKLKNQIRRVSRNNFVSGSLNKRISIVDGNSPLTNQLLPKMAVKAAFYLMLVESNQNNWDAWFDKFAPQSAYIFDSRTVSVGRENARDHMIGQLSYIPSLIYKMCGMYVKRNSISVWTDNVGKISSKKTMHFTDFTTLFMEKGPGGELHPYLVSDVIDKDMALSRTMAWIFRNTLHGGPAFRDLVKGFFTSSKKVQPEPVEISAPRAAKTAPSADEIHVAKGKKSKNSNQGGIEMNAPSNHSPLSSVIAEAEIFN